VQGKAVAGGGVQKRGMVGHGRKVGAGCAGVRLAKGVGGVGQYGQCVGG